MDEDEHWRFRSAGPVNIELFDFGRPIGKALRGTDTCAHCLAVAIKTFAYIGDKGFVIHLVVGRIEFDLVVVHEDQRPFVMRWRSHLTSLGESRRSRNSGGRSEHSSAADLLHSILPTAEQFRGGGKGT